MYASDIPIKPRRKTLEVPVHSSQENLLYQHTKRTNSAGRKFKHKSNENLGNSARHHEKTTAIVEDEEKSPRVSKKSLQKEITRLLKEKEDITVKFYELESLSVEKINKLREKIEEIQKRNEDKSREYSHLKNQFQELSSGYEDVKTQLDKCKVCHSCEEYKQSLDKILKENNQLRISNKEVNDDINMLKTVVFRLNVQLERYQEKLRKHSIADIKGKHIYQQGDITSCDHQITPESLQGEHGAHPHVPLSWGKVNSHTLGPLLVAFQDTINEKDDIIAEYEKEMSNFTANFKEVLTENESLHVRLSEDERCSGKLREQLDGCKNELQNYKEHNDILIKKCALKQDKIEEILKCYEIKVEQLKRDYNVLHDSYCKANNEIASLNQQNKSLMQIHEEFKNEKKDLIPLALHTSSVNECKKWYEELKQQYENEKVKLNANLDLQSKVIADLNAKIIAIGCETDKKDEQINSMEKIIKKGEQKYLELEQHLNETQLARTACKRQLHKVMHFAKDLVSEQETLMRALNQRQQENKVVTKIGADIASRMDKLKVQLKEVQRGAWQELNTVEGKIQEQQETIETLKMKHSEEINKLEDIIKKQADNAILVKSQTALPISPYILFRNKYQD